MILLIILFNPIDDNIMANSISFQACLKYEVSFFNNEKHDPEQYFKNGKLTKKLPDPEGGVESNQGNKPNVVNENNKNQENENEVGINSEVKQTPSVVGAGNSDLNLSNDESKEESNNISLDNQSNNINENQTIEKYEEEKENSAINLKKNKIEKIFADRIKSESEIQFSPRNSNLLNYPRNSITSEILEFNYETSLSNKQVKRNSKFDPKNCNWKISHH